MTGLSDPDRQFALTHVPEAQRPALMALWSLDEVLGRIVASTTQPMVGQMRLTWWHDALCGLDRGEVAAEPVLMTLADIVPANGVTGVALAGLVEGWEALLETPLTDGDLADYAKGRGTWLFALCAEVLGAVRNDVAGAGWALADFGGRCSDPDTASRAFAMAGEYLGKTDPKSLPRPLRILVRLARHDVAAGAHVPRTPWKLLRSIA